MILKYLVKYVLIDAFIDIISHFSDSPKVFPRKSVHSPCRTPQCQSRQEPERKKNNIRGQEILELVKKNPAYGRQRISRPMRIVGPLQFWRG